MALSSRDDPYGAYTFLVEIDDLVVGGFAEVTGLEVEIEALEYREGGVNDYVHRFAGPARHPANVVLRRGLTAADELWSWHQEVVAGRIVRRNASIVVLGDAGDERVRWNVVDALPVRWSGPEVRAGSASVGVEALELADRGLRRDG